MIDKVRIRIFDDFVCKVALALVLIFMAVCGVSAQNAVVAAPSRSVSEQEAMATEQNIVERIMAESGGMIVIDVDNEVLRQILTHPVRTGETRRNDNRPGKYTVQIYQNQSSKKAIGEARAQKVRARFPQFKVRSRTYSPNFYVWVGEFKTREDAQKALSDLQRSFPEFSREMRVTTIR